MADFSPMMKQYFETKEKYPNTILFFRLGDFYEMFFNDAKTVSRELELTLTGRECGQDERAPMCGVPYHSAESYIAKLVAKGYKVAICEQLEDPKLAKGMVKRDVIRVITPGTVLENSMLDETRNNFICSLYYQGDSAGLCFADVSTGELVADQVTAPDGRDHGPHHHRPAGPLQPQRDPAQPPGHRPESPGGVYPGPAGSLGGVHRAGTGRRLRGAHPSGSPPSLAGRASGSWAFGKAPDRAVPGGAAGLSGAHPDQRPGAPERAGAGDGLRSDGAGPQRPAEPGDSPRPCGTRRSGAPCCGCWTRPRPPWGSASSRPGWSSPF